MDGTDAARRAIELWHQAYELHMQGELDEAIELYTQSIEACPTAEAYTFRGWAKSHKDEVDEAIEDCHRAIAVDPEFGNPYNDIGSYLLRKGQRDEAIPWLERAKRATRYEPKHFPFLNLGRIYLAKGELGRAIVEFEGALELNPGDEATADMIRQLRLKLN
jgi:tetratricopeptide (TPR) repeat protein